MKRLNKIIPGTAAAIVALAFGTSSAHALNITINDTIGGGGIGQGLEDGETEPNTVNNQSWDLEAFTLNGSTLKINSGFNLLAGNSNFGLGDIFIDVNGDAKYGSGLAGVAGTANVANSLFNYDYVIHFTDRNATSQAISGSYQVYSLTGGAILSQGYYDQNDGSNPFAYVSGGTALSGIGASGTMNVDYNPTSNLTLEDGTQITGGGHYIGSLDLSFLAGTTSDVLFHVTEGCGNDNLVGKTSGGFDRVPDGGSTLMMMGFGMSGLAFARGRFKRKS